MAFLSKVKDSTKDIKLGDPRKVFTSMLANVSGGGNERSIKYSMLYTIYAFRGISGGIGVSTIVANTALALADLGLSVCVVDTSILSPSQDVLLKTGRGRDDLDWFDMPYTKNGFLRISGLSNRISVLSFGEKRTVVDAVGTKDTSALVSMMITTVQGMFDVILIDCCNELTEINTACLQQAHRVIQVWDDSPVTQNNLERFVTNMDILTCPVDKMHYVVLSMLDTINYKTSFEEVYNKYGFKQIASIDLEPEIRSVINRGSMPYTEATRNKGIQQFSDGIIDIACVICNITDNSTGTITQGAEKTNKEEVEEELC